MKMTVIRDAEGVIINIGEWDARITEDGEGVLIETNPLPKGAKRGKANIIKGWDGGLYEESDPRQHGPK